MQVKWFVIVIWFTGFNCLLSTTGGATLVPDEVDALKEIGKSLGKTDWNFSVDPCSGEQGWATTKLDNFENNVTCNCSATVCHVTRIILKAQSLSGVLPPELVKLPFLQTIDLTRNYLDGTLPTEWGSTKLLNISVQGNRLYGQIPKEFANISTLEDFNLESNYFSGPLPPELGSLPVLKRVLFSSNYFNGTLPQTLANLSTLKDFRISDNNFTGKIPDFIQNWTKLNKLVIQASGLEGPIPSGISLLTGLTDMRFSDLKGPGSAFPPISNLISLKTLTLRSCNITGELPGYLGDFTNLKVLDLSFNNLIGEVPDSFSRLSKVDFVDLSYNNFTSGAFSCQQNNANLFGSSLLRNNSGVVPCLKSFRCPRKYSHSLNINCGGGEVIINGTTYEEDLDTRGPSIFIESKSKYWALSSTGDFTDNDKDTDTYVTQNSSRLSMENYELYTTARLSPISLTYYGYCMLNGNYTVYLHFAEIIFTSDRTYSSLGRRIFDVYIQGKRVLKDFNIEGEAGGVGKEHTENFTALVTSTTLEIRLFWAGKGTTGIPNRGVYGPLISAISVNSNFVPPSEGGKKISAGLVAGIIVSVLCLVFVIAGILRWKGCLGRQNTIDQELRGLDLQTGSFTLRQIKAATHNFDPVNKIGEGGFGPVYKGLLADGTIIAVKQLSSKSKQGNREFVNEIGMISALQHPNLVKLYGCCIEGNQLLLVYEYLENNSLARALFGPEEFRIKLDWRTRHKICVGIARGLAYLHEESRLKIVHRDIKATNVLLDKDLYPKISDFGLAKLDEEDNTHISTRIAGTFGYMAPEYAMRGYLTDKADVYSFGIVALEIVSGRSNSNSRPKEESVYLLDWAMVLQQKDDLMELVDPRLGSDYKKEEVLGMLNIALACTNASSTLRPTMSSVVSMLEGRTAVQEFVSDPNISIDDSKFKHIKESYLENRDERPVDTHTRSMSVDGPWTGSATSTSDLYPLKLDSDYWSNRE
ncbi:hypothetical protein GIB67_027057 [Kingdonia uniflora]|uniref:non-specific serine/threonine protein kinase n=1 Tax=Kingdonia uniflora TaxID=39325 RepID=A0A7J7P2A6_9MAGN|nr:hypothetical protein GIB67_027057 [Kingdonia uniflora]